MSSISKRKLEIWRSSQAEELKPIHGAFFIQVEPTTMIRQTLEYLHEKSGQDYNAGLISGFLAGMRYYRPNDSVLIWLSSFADSDELFAFDLEILADAIKRLEMHTDINITYSQIRYMADIGSGPNLPLMVINRVPIGRGVAFEIEERGIVSESIRLGDFELSNKVRVCQQHYSTGMGLLAADDSLTGLVDAAFMQFYLCMEGLLETHEMKKAPDQGRLLYGERFTAEMGAIVKHVYLARHRFFGHSHPKYLKGILDTETAFDIAKQTLVARWIARALLSFELNRPLVIREMRLYPKPNYSIGFFGSGAELDQEFRLP